jgi:hypothetical protein
MTDDHIRGTRPNKESGKISVDDMGIPILEEVVDQKHDTKPTTKADKEPEPTRTSGLNFSLPNNEILVTALRNQLRSQINKDIDEIAAEVSGNIVSSLTQELEQRVRSELVDILQRNLDDMINHAISQDPKRES